MSRTQEFEPAEALQKAMEVFWEKGYGNSSMDDIVTRTGVSRYGLYGEFGSKKELYRAALEHYCHQNIETRLAGLARPDAGVQDVKDFFMGALAHCQCEEGRLGCMLCYTSVELGIEEEEMAEFVNTAFGKMRAALRHALQNAKQREEVPSDLDVAETADFLTGIIMGLSTMARSAMDPQLMKNFVKGGLARLG